MGGGGGACSAGVASTVLIVVMLIAFATTLAVIERAKTRNIREGFSWTDWNFGVEGRVGEVGYLTDKKQQDIRNKINKANKSFSSCEHAGVYLAPEWRPTNKKNTCALDMINPLVRNKCEHSNTPLYDPNVVHTLYIDPTSYKCNVVFKPGVNKKAVQQYKRSVNVGALLDEVTHLKQEISNLKDAVLVLKNHIRDLKSKINSQNHEIKGLHDRISNLKSKVHHLEQEISNHESKVSTLQHKINMIKHTSIQAQAHRTVQPSSSTGG